MAVKDWKKVKIDGIDGYTWVNKFDRQKYLNVDNITFGKLLDGWQVALLFSKGYDNFDVKVLKPTPTKRLPALKFAKEYMRKH
ncbi:MAG: hypothetical protein ACOCV1_00110 [Bacillota bacterium]